MSSINSKQQIYCDWDIGSSQQYENAVNKSAAAKACISIVAGERKGLRQSIVHMTMFITIDI